MDIRVSGHQVEVGAALKGHIEDRLGSIADKYFSRAISAQVTLAKGPHDAGFECDIVSHVMQGVILKGSGKAQDAHRAFDGAADRVEKQLRRYMQRLKDRKMAGANGSAPDLDAGYVVFQADDDVDMDVDINPVVVAETRVDIPEASVSDAVMMLDLRNTTALLFKNAGTGSFNMVYRREDGNIGWVEPRRQAN